MMTREIDRSGLAVAMRAVMARDITLSLGLAAVVIALTLAGSL
jgi:hypothetical protein